MTKPDSPITAHFGYSLVEQAIADVLPVARAARGAFRGRLQHLRKLGVPKLPTPGSGKKILYTLSDAFEMLVALRLERANCPPKIARIGAKVARKHETDAAGRNLLLLFMPGEGFLPIEQNAITHFANELDEFAVVNISRSLETLRRAMLARAT